MRWKDRRRSSNVEDRRGAGGFGGLLGGGSRSGRRVSGRRGMGGGTMIILALIAIFFGKDLSGIFNLLMGGGGAIQAPQQTQQQARYPTQNQNNANRSRGEDEAAEFVKVILAETEDTWAQIFNQIGQRYIPPKLVLYSGMVRSACGTSSSASGPFYCPGDSKIYIDLSFLDEMRRMGAQGDFAFAYVIAHEVGHHVQNLVGLADDVRRSQRSASKAQSNAIQVKMELQADCLAGVWTNHTENRNAILEQGDIQEGMDAAAAVGDDRISRGRLPRESYTHGSSKERVHWFQQGLTSGDIRSCNTFAGF